MQVFPIEHWRRHSEIRARRRYRKRLTDQARCEIVFMIEKGDYEEKEPSSHGRDRNIYVLFYRGTMIKIVFHEPTKEIITFLPPDETKEKFYNESRRYK